MNKSPADKSTNTLRVDVAIWSLLIAFTLLSWWLGHVPRGFPSEMITTIILAITFVKIRLVIFHFMEILKSSLALRLVFDSWCIGVGTMLILLLRT
jgi:heme/copper-type cytochrome/quinol oxidase subunit 4